MKKFQLLPLFILFIFVIQACDFSSGSDEITQENSFEATVYDEAGKIVTTINHNSTNNKGQINSFAIFGNDFIPDRIKENLAENTGLSPEDFLQGEVYLHVESGQEDNNHATFRFTIARDQGFVPKKYIFAELDEEILVKRLKNIWNFMRESSGNSLLTNRIDSPDHGLNIEDYANFEFYQKGHILGKNFENRVSEDSYNVSTSSGYLEIVEISEKEMKGNFTSTILAFPGSIFFGEEFPDEIDFIRFTIEGSFTAILGDYEDLIRTTNHFPFYFPLN
ncbi:MAG: hypothetical protein JJU37_01670 [Balneolaceae bacterium]|nr:hypothetical protein [Balneolaceae bacterium]